MPDIQFKIHRIGIDQFATLKEPVRDDANFDITVTPGCNTNFKAVAVSVEVRFIEDDNPLLLLETSSFFELHKDSWSELTDKGTGNVIIPESFLIALVQISISQTRGVLSAKTEGTPFAKFLLPIVDVSRFGIKGDMVILPDGSIKE